MSHCCYGPQKRETRDKMALSCTLARPPSASKIRWCLNDMSSLDIASTHLHWFQWDFNERFDLRDSLATLNGPMSRHSVIIGDHETNGKISLPFPFPMLPSLGASFPAPPRFSNFLISILLPKMAQRVPSHRLIASPPNVSTKYLPFLPISTSHFIIQPSLVESSNLILWLG